MKAVYPIFEEAVIEHVGTNRYKATKVDFKLDCDGKILATTYNVGRRTRIEPFELVSKHEALCMLDKVTMLELATHHPQIYWCLYYHTNGKVEKTLEEHGLLQTKRKIKK